MKTTIRLAKQTDSTAWKNLRQQLWPKCSQEQHETELFEYLTEIGHKAAFVAEIDNELVGFIEVAIRDHAEGVHNAKPIGYIEGWYVSENYRGQGIGNALMQMAEAWAKEHNCQVMASDVELDNTQSLNAHLKLGYHEHELLIHLVKNL